MNHDLLVEAMLRAGNRRDFVRATGGFAGLLALGILPARRADATTRFAAYAFTLGIASGEPTPSGVVLWTRLAPDPLNGGGMGSERVPVAWEIAADEGFRRIVQSGEVLATPELGHSVHVEVEGLEPSRHYWYRFNAGGEQSRVGRTRTAPALGSSPERLSFAFVSCQNWQSGYYVAHRHLAGEDLDLVVHLGDYIYENGPGDDVVRPHNSPEIFTLADYRNRYALYKSDEDLQAAHASAPFVVTWDDHEVDNDYSGSIQENGAPVEEFLRRRAAAYQAYYEHMPLRRSSMPVGPDLLLYRRLTYGDLATFSVLDTRQYRSQASCGTGLVASCPEAEHPSATILGAAQEAWLLDGLASSRTRWNVLANQVPIAPMRRQVDGEMVASMDKWAGYVPVRERVLNHIRDRQVPNPVVITGDIHLSWVAEIPSDRRDGTSTPIGTEFVGTSISSGGNGAPMSDYGRSILENNPNAKYFNGQRGYVRNTVTPAEWRADFRVLPYVDRRDAPISTDATWVIEAGRPGVQRG